MEDKLKKLIEGIIKDAKENGVEVEIQTLKVGQPRGKLCFDFYEDGDIRCRGENISTKQVLTAIHQLISRIMEQEDVSYDKAIKLIEGSKEKFENDYRTVNCGGVCHESN